MREDTGSRKPSSSWAMVSSQGTRCLARSRKRSQQSSTSEPTLYRLGCIARLRVEAQLGARRLRVDKVQKLLEEQQVRGCAQAGAEHDAIEPALLQRLGHDRFRRRRQPSTHPRSRPIGSAGLTTSAREK